MKYLLDTHTLIWALTETNKLSENVRGILANPDHDIVVSTVTFWEISLKYSLGKLDLGAIRPEEFPDACQSSRFTIEPVSAEISSTYHQLPVGYHRDPFDRLLIWQAIRQQYALISIDSNIAKYTSEGLKVVW